VSMNRKPLRSRTACSAHAARNQHPRSHAYSFQLSTTATLGRKAPTAGYLKRVCVKRRSVIRCSRGWWLDLDAPKWNNSQTRMQRSWPAHTWRRSWRGWDNSLSTGLQTRAANPGKIELESASDVREMSESCQKSVASK
jgi:hypothetical protein